MRRMSIRSRRYHQVKASRYLDTSQHPIQSRLRLGRRIKMPELADLRLPRREVDAIARAATWVELPQGAYPVRAGAPVREWFLLVSGALSIQRDGVDVTRIEGLAPVGELDARPSTLRAADVVTNEDSSVLVFGTREWMVLREVAPRFRAWVEGFAAEPLNVRPSVRVC